MLSHKRKRITHHRHALGFALLTVCGIAAIQAFTASMHLGAPEDSMHDAAASTYVVCHAIPKAGTVNGTEQYFCSNVGCYPDDSYDVKVIGTYPDEDTCGGIAGSLEEGLDHTGR